MNFENVQWNNADEEFNSWLGGNKHDGNLSTIEILKSAFFVFRKKQLDKLTNLCNHAFEVFRDEERRKLESLLVYDSGIRYSIRHDKKELEPGYFERLTKEKNNKIINGILSGEQQVFNDLYEYEFPKVVRLITNNSGNIDSAKDIFQDALVILIEKINRDELDLTCSIETYLYSICRILWLEQLRKDKKTVSLDDSYSHIETDILIVNHDIVPDIYEDVNNAIEKLGDPCKQLLECFYYKRMSWNDIAVTLGYKNAASAKNQKYKYLERIRSTISFDMD